MTGQASTIAEAAAVAGITEGHALQRSAAEGWVAERAAHMERERRELAKETAEQESRIQAAARRLAWRVAYTSLQRMEKQLEDPAHKVNPFGVEALVRAAMALSGVGDQEADEAVLRLRRKPMREVVREFVKVMQDLGADEPLEVPAVEPAESPPADPSSTSTPPP